MRVVLVTLESHAAARWPRPHCDMISRAPAPARAAQPCFQCKLPTRHGSTCRWCSSTGGISPLADLARKRGRIGELAESTGIAALVLRRAAVADGTLTVCQAVRIARYLGCGVAELSIEHVTERSRARAAAARRAGAA